MMKSEKIETFTISAVPFGRREGEPRDLFLEEDEADGWRIGPDRTVLGPERKLLPLAPRLTSPDDMTTGSMGREGRIDTLAGHSARLNELWTYSEGEGEPR